MSVEPPDEFEKELIDIFAQEAREWLQQIHVALDELQQAPPPDQHVKLAHTIKAGVTNLGGAAATIGLYEVERASLAAVRFVEAVQNPTDTITAREFTALCKHLGAIHTALIRATGRTFDAEVADGQIPGRVVTVHASELLAALHRVQSHRSHSRTSSRNLLHMVIAQVEGLKKNGIELCNVTSIRECLQRWSDGEEQFLDTVRSQAPSITAELACLQNGTDRSRHSSQSLGAVVEQAAQLLATAQQINASQAMTFFMGLHSFLTMVMQQRVIVATQTYAAVRTRLDECVRALETWVEAGRAERSAISGILPN